MNPLLEQVEISNYGEVFLNPQLLPILEYAHQKNVAICGFRQTVALPSLSQSKCPSVAQAGEPIAKSFLMCGVSSDLGLKS